jgi:6-phosphogluconolactonase (cycloisomerase 2 family)
MKLRSSLNSSGSSVSAYSILPSGGLSLLQSFTFKLTAPGTIPSRQEAPHPHQALLDPTGSFIVVPDLGADLVRVFSVNPTDSSLKEIAPLATPPGAGPRHGAFLKTATATYFFLVGELDNVVRSYKVTYGMDLIGFEEVFSAGMYGPDPTPIGAAAAEILVSVSIFIPSLRVHF